MWREISEETQEEWTRDLFGGFVPEPWPPRNEAKKDKESELLGPCKQLWDSGFCWKEMKNQYKVWLEGVLGFEWNHIECVKEDGW